MKPKFEPVQRRPLQCRIVVASILPLLSLLSLKA